MNLEHLKALCERAPEVVFQEDRESDRFYTQFSPKFCLKLLSIIETQGKALERIAKNGGHNAGMGYTNARCAYEALTAVDGILGEENV
jgi:hypothetical protein